MKRGIAIAGAILMVLAAMPVMAAKNAVVKLPEGSSLKVEHLIWSHSSNMYLDGPALEAQSPHHRGGSGGVDGEGNVWFGLGKIGIINSIGGRCLDRGTGMIRPYFSDDYWTGFADRDEGPGCVFPTTERSFAGLGVPRDTYSIYGSPLKGVENGYFLFSNGVKIRKVWMDPEKDNSWWFKTIIGGGKTPLPGVKGGTVNAREVKITSNMSQVLPDGRIIVFSSGGFYEYREKEKDLICLLGYDDYNNKSALVTMKGNSEKPKAGVMGGDGTFYMGTYFGSGFSGKKPTNPCIWRMVPGGKVEPYARTLQQGGPYDGPAMASDAHCGHHFWAQMHNYANIPADTLLITAHDECTLRRIRNGRVSSLCPDGEWRELADDQRKSYKAPWFWGASSAGPGGIVTGENKGLTTSLTYITTGVDFTKATVAPQLNTTIPPWPPKGGEKKGGK